MGSESFHGQLNRAFGNGDIDDAMARGRHLHAEPFQRLVRLVVDTVEKLTRRARARRDERLAYEELSRMDDRELHDLGLTRADIAQVAYGPADRHDPSRTGKPVANENRPALPADDTPRNAA